MFVHKFFLIFLLFFISLIESHNTLNVPAIGRTAEFGALYNAYKNEFTGINILKKSSIENYVKSVENPNTKYTYSFASKKSDKMIALDIKGEIQLRIALGFIKVGGAAEFILRKQYSSKSIECSLILKSTTTKKTFNWRLEELNDYFDFTNIGFHATHMIVGIQYGGNAVVTLSQKVTDDLFVIKGKLQRMLEGGGIIKKLAISATANTMLEGSLNFTDHDEGVDINVEADVAIESGDDVTNINGARKFMQSMGGRISKYNHGKGVQISYELIPLEILRNHFRIIYLKNLSYKPLSPHILHEISEMLSDIEKLIEIMNDHCNELNENQIYFTKNETNWWKMRKSNFDKAVNRLYKIIDESIVVTFHREKADTKLFKANKNLIKLTDRVSAFTKHCRHKLFKKMDYIKDAEKVLTFFHSERELHKLKRESKKFSMLVLPNLNFEHWDKFFIDFLNLIKAANKSATNKEGIILIVNPDIILHDIDEFDLGDGMNSDPLLYTDERYFKIIKVNNEDEKYRFIPFLVRESIGCTRNINNCTSKQLKNKECFLENWVFLPKNTKIPTTKVLRSDTNSLTNYEVNQKFMVEIHEGTEKDTTKNQNLGEISMTIMQEQKGPADFTIIMEINEDGYLKVEWLFLGQRSEVRIDYSMTLTSQEILALHAHFDTNGANNKSQQYYSISGGQLILKTLKYYLS